jgi:regulatory protein YycI of two-component signal transduction system YycFG
VYVSEEGGKGSEGYFMYTNEEKKGVREEQQYLNNVKIITNERKAMTQKESKKESINTHYFTHMHTHTHTHTHTLPTPPL